MTEPFVETARLLTMILTQQRGIKKPQPEAAEKLVPEAGSVSSAMTLTTALRI